MIPPTPSNSDSNAARPRLSVVIPTRNEADNILRCIGSFREHAGSGTVTAPVEIIVVDNDSTDETVARARSTGAAVHCRGPERSAQRNFGALEVARGDYVLFMDADMSMPPETVDELLARIGAAAPPDLIYIPEVLVGRGYWVRVRNWERAFYNLTPIDAFRAVRRTLLGSVGGFDERLISAEDWDLDRRLRTRTASWILLSHPVYHHEPEQNMERLLRKKRYYARHIDRYTRKWGRSDPRVRKQFGFCYRFCTVFLEQGKWRRSLRRPDRLISVWAYRLLMGVQCIHGLRARRPPGTALTV